MIATISAAVPNVVSEVHKRNSTAPLNNNTPDTWTVLTQPGSLLHFSPPLSASVF